MLWKFSVSKYEIKTNFFGRVKLDLMRKTIKIAQQKGKILFACLPTRMKRNAVPRRKMNLFNVFPPTVFGKTKKTKKTIFFFSLSYKRLALKICSRDEDACCCDALSLLRPFSRPPSLFEEVGFSSRALKLSRDRLGEGFNNHGSEEHT